MSRSDDGHISKASLASTNPIISIFNPDRLDPFRHTALRQSTVDISVSTEGKKILGTVEDVRRTALKYFNSIYRRMPILSKSKYLEHLPSLYTAPQADFITLCLCLCLVVQYPQEGLSMQTSLYVMVKNYISLLEATGFLTLSVIQSRVLISFYEMGHGMLPAASISIGACARAARALGLNKKAFQTVKDDDAARIRAEEEKRVWWAIICLDR
jgi:hypothetical protein